jgi:hypothetical protein
MARGVPPWKRRECIGNTVWFVLPWENPNYLLVLRRPMASIWHILAANDSESGKGLTERDVTDIIRNNRCQETHSKKIAMRPNRCTAPPPLHATFIPRLRSSAVFFASLLAFFLRLEPKIKTPFGIEGGHSAPDVPPRFTEAARRDPERFPKQLPYFIL